MIVKREHKINYVLIFLIVLIASYFTLRVCTLVEQNGGDFKIDYLNEALNTIYKFNTPLIINTQTVGISIFVGFMTFVIIFNYQLSIKKNIQENTYGSSDWETPDTIKKFRDPVFENNQIFTSTELFSKNMRISKRNRNVTLIGRPGTGKSRSYFKPNILSANGESLIITDPKGELLRDCGMSLVNNGYDIKVLNLVDKSQSDNFNPLMYIRRIPKEYKEIDMNNGLSISEEIQKERIQEDDVMTLINVLMQNTKSDTIESNTGDPFWEKAEMVFLQAIMYYVIFNYEDKDKNFKTILELIRLAEPDKEGNSQLGRLFDVWERKDPDNVGIKQWNHFKVSASSPKMMSTIIMTASARLAPFNIAELENMTTTDTLELSRIGEEGDKGKIACFIITSPNNSTFNFLANILYSQIFTIIDYNASQHNGSLPSGCQIYMDEWSQLGTIPRFLEMLAYIRGLNCGVTIGLQSLSQYKKVYKDNWETGLDCCDYTLFLGSRSKETLEYISLLMGKKTWYKKSSGRTFSKQGSSSTNWDIVGRELSTVDEIARMKEGYCILLVSGLRPFTSKVYNIKNHPRYSELFEPWDKERTAHNYYNHKRQREMTKEMNKYQTMLNELGLPFAKVQKLEMRPITEFELNKMDSDILLSNKTITDELLDSL